MFRYLIRFPLWLLVILARYPMAFIAVAFQKDYHLRPPFRWLDTIDNSLLGDQGWLDEHLSGSNPASYKNMVRWIWRNGGNRYNYEVLGVRADAVPEWAFERRVAFKYYKERFFEFRWGWALSGPQKGLCKYVWNPRFKTKP